MNANELYKEVLGGLAMECRRRWGRIQEAENKSCGIGTSSRWINLSREIPLKSLFEFLCALGVAPQGFFGRALGRPMDTEALLADLIVDHRAGDRAWREVESAARELERGGDVEAPSGRRAASPDAGELVTGFARAGRREQMRRLRKTARYRHPEVAQGLLEYLDALCDEQPDLAQALAARVAIHLVPAIPWPLETRAELECRALGVFGSALSVRKDHSTAARAFFLALQLAQRHGLQEARARLLHRIARLLEDAGNADMALIALREALEIHVHTGSGTSVGKTLVLQARMFGALDEHDKAIEVLKRGLLHLPDGPPELAPYHRLAYRTLARAQQQLGHQEEARRALDRAAEFEQSTPLIQAERGRRRRESSLTFSDSGRAGQRPPASRQESRVAADPLRELLGAVALVQSLMNQGELEQACKIASGVAAFLEPVQDNPVVKAAILQLARAGLEGRLSRGLVRDARGHLKRLGAEARAR